jgi:hypothetical protein
MGFVYHSEQVHRMNGKTKRNIVNIKNGKGEKITEINHGKRKTRKVSKLTKKEMSQIRKNKFIPKLFAPERQILGLRR